MTAFLCVNGLQQEPIVTRKLIPNDKKTPNNKHGSLITSRTRKGGPSVSGQRFRSYRPPSTPRVSRSAVTRPPQLPRDDCTFRFPQSLSEILANGSSIRPTPGDTFCLQELPHTSTPLYPRTLRNLQARRVRFRPRLLASSPGCWGKWLLKSKLSQLSRRAGGRAAHSQLVDGVLRDDRVGGEVRDHVGAPEAAGAGGGRLPLAGQRAQGHGASSRLAAPHPGPSPARARGARVGLRRAPSGQRRGQPRLPASKLGPPGRAETVAAALGLGCVVSAAGRSQQPAPTRVRGGALRRGWHRGRGRVRRAERVGPLGAPPRSSWHPPDTAACISVCGERALRIEASLAWARKASVSWECFHRKVLLLERLYILNPKPHFSNVLKTLKRRSFTNATNTYQRFSIY